jgi:hypothetical protein
VPHHIFDRLNRTALKSKVTVFYWLYLFCCISSSSFLTCWVPVFNGPAEDPSVAEPPLKIDGDADRYGYDTNYSDFIQSGNLFRLFSNIAEAMQGVPQEIIERQLKL